MCGNVFFNFFFCLLINYYMSTCKGHCITDLKFETFSNISNDVTEESNQNDLSEQVMDNNSNYTVEKNMFWTIPDVNANATEANLDFQINSQDIEPVKSDDKSDTLEESRNDTASINNSSTNMEIHETNENLSPDILSNDTDFTMYEKITLPRNNCQLEINIPETHDLKIEIRFGKLENNTCGQCCITLNGNKNNMLGVLISNVHLYENTFQEVLKVITANYGLDFVLKEYHSWSKYEPLLLTETHKVYAVLYYNVTHVPLNQSITHFNLEVFSYKKYDN